MKNSLNQNRPQNGDKEYHPCHNGNEPLECVEDMSRSDTGQEQMLYDVADSPPFVLTIVFAFQQALSSLPTALTVSLFVADAACASDFLDIRTYLLSATLFMSGVTTLLMVTVGVRIGWLNEPRNGVSSDRHSDKFGTPLFNTGVFVAFLIATVISILDSVGDYYACARVCNLPPPPRNAINRGIAIEGLCTAISGAVGCGHATTTFGENIGTIGLTKVASRDLFVGLALVYMLFGVVSKVSAVFLSIPYPVLGGSIIVLYGMFNGIILSNLKFISLSSTRNISIIGTSLLLGLMVPKWIEDEPDGISTGDSYYDNIIRTLLVNPNLCGGVLAFFLDNTVPGTRRERGIDVWHKPTTGNGDIPNSESELAIYNPWFPKKWLSKKICRFVPFCPDSQLIKVDSVDEYSLVPVNSVSP
ncbi:solute carrier family 23 member 1-like [Mizuhopecten yessoensis]|uniref:solute carrier family 23 member 1-like n=1 Tax=Mizuhopecten yessoensis TaxID=6573 RepID=UPI000B45F501|nr:solute carrier family 23 member 1-like [Mizuhopecten yessoensis]